MFAELLFAAALATAAAEDANVAAPLAPVRLEYEVRRNGKPIGVSSIALARDATGAWTLETRTEGTAGLAAATGAEVVEQSVFAWRDGRPELRRYRYAQAVAWRDKHRELDLLPDAAGIAFDDGKRTGRLPYEPGLMDRHVVVLAIARDIGAHATTLEYRVADKNRIDTQRYRVAGTERITCRAGSFATTRIERVRDNPGRTTTSWLAAETQWLPVRMLQTEPDGETIEMLLVALPRPATP